MKNLSLFGCVSIAALLATGAAHAQTTSAATLDEIVVTAQRRSESLQDAAISVQAVSGEQIAQAGVSQAADLYRLVPSVQIAQSFMPSVLIAIRGVQNFSVTPFGEGAVAVNYDDVYVSRPSAFAGMFYDLERVEVLKGPQGTLYGRNATGGAINVIPAAPKIGAFGGRAQVEFGNYNLSHFEGALNLPLGDKAALRVATNLIDRDGYMSDGTLDDVGEAVRVALRYEPTSDLSFTLTGDYAHQGGIGSGQTLIAPSGGPGIGGSYFNSTRDPASCGAIQAYYGPLETSLCSNIAAIPNRQDNTAWGVKGLLEWQFGGAALTLIAAHRSTEIDTFVNYGTTIYDGTKDTENVLEARLSSNSDGPLEWLVGGYLFEEKLDGPYDLQLPTGLGIGYLTQDQDFNLDTRAAALFGSATYSVTDKLRLTLGGRLSREEKTSDSRLVTAFIGPPTVALSQKKREWDKFDWRAGVEYDVAPNSLLFANVATGFRSGGFYFGPPSFPNSYEPEEVEAYTIGSKNQFFDNRLRLNAEAFYYKYSDQQVTTAVYASLASYVVTVNAGRASIKGAELEADYLLAENTRIGGNVQYLDATYDSLIIPSVINQRTGCVNRPDPQNPLPSSLIDCSGMTAPLSPEWNARFYLDQNWDLSNGGKINFNVSLSYQSESLGSTDYIPFQRLDSYWTGDLSVAYRAPENWSLGAWVNNVTDEEIIGNASGVGTTFLDGQVIPATGTPRPPRTYGVRLTYEF